jgi:hypothetical protein
MHKSSRMHLELRGFKPRGEDPTISIGGRWLILESDPGIKRRHFYFSESTSFLRPRSRANHQNSQNSCRVPGLRSLFTVHGTFPTHAPSCAAASESTHQHYSKGLSLATSATTRRFAYGLSQS